MMDINNGWFEPLNHTLTDPQQQTFVTKHDLELLHKKIIATDLIVQKYQDANRALSRLQAENDNLRQQVDQITNECCIFSKQVTECTQECDSLKEQISILNGEKREMQQQLRLLQDENTNNYHEIMVLKQYESLKGINDDLTKTVERQQKHLAKLQLQVQRKSPIVYKPNKASKEPSETDIALVNSQKAVRELKLALERLVSFIQISNIEIPTALNIRPVLKAYDISDDFLEIEGEIFRKPVKKKRKPVVTQTVVQEEADGDDEDDADDFIEVTDTVQTPVVNTNVPVENTAEETPLKTSARSKKQQEKKETKKTRTSPIKTRRQTELSKSENATTNLADMETRLELALSQPNEPEPISPMRSFFSDDDDIDNKTSASDKPQLSTPVYNPLISRSTINPPKTNSSITIIPKSSKPISSNVSFLSDDDNEEPPQQRLPPIATFIAPKSANVPIRVDRITPMESESTEKSAKYTSFLSEEDEDNKSLSSASTPVTIQPSPFLRQENISPLKTNDAIPETNTNTTEKSLASMTPILSSDTSQQSSSSPMEEDPVLSIIPMKTINPNHIKIVLRLLDVLTQVPPPKKPLRLVRRRIQRKKASQSKPIDENVTTSTSELANSSPPVPINATTDSTMEADTITPTEKQAQVIEEKLVNQVSLPTEKLPEFTEHSLDTTAETSQPTVAEISPDDQIRITTEERLESVDTRQEIILETVEQHAPISGEKEEPAIMPVADKEPVRNIRMDIVQEKIVVPNKPSIVLPSQESRPIIETTQFKQPLPPPLLIPPVPKTLEQNRLKPLQLSIITRLLNVLTNLPVKPLTLPTSFPTRKRKRRVSVKKPSVPLPRPPTNPTSHSPVRMQTRSLNTIRSCLARCNQPVTNIRKRTATSALASTSSVPSTAPKRMKSMKIEQSANEYDSITKFLNSLTKQIHDEVGQMIERKLHEDTSLFNDHIYRIISELMINKCSIILPLVNQLHPYEESIQVLLTFINSKSTTFPKHFIAKLNQTFEYDVKQHQSTIHKRIKTLNRLFFLSCSIFTLSSSGVAIYARLFDIGYHLPHAVLTDALSFVSNVYSSLISVDCQTNSSNVLLHQVLFDIFKESKINVSLEYLENLLIGYHRYTHDREDLLRCFVLISRSQTWPWCAGELCKKLLFPLLTRIDAQDRQRETILMILQYVLYLYKDNGEFQRDLAFHDQTKQLLLSLKTMTDDECSVRDRTLSIFHTCCQINE
ncbi:unnamed protein product [Adineta ricciae]|uniref:Uncharacterized protein n=1 Tax=Adineta ricciae TaxID=249248 RepID=A0A816AAB9_ADIRI|nr:unnamed protein product [Adineta ricciae]CAF1592476.1 unnamed protein product [Adineta ricciae]